MAAAMSAEVNEIHRYQAVCLACGWWSDEVESMESADRDADEHDDEYHPDARPVHRVADAPQRSPAISSQGEVAASFIATPLRCVRAMAAPRRR
jgi:hypothetical protein